MSIIVKGMKMPATCTRCTLDVFGYCTAARRYSEGSATHGRASFCPLAELPEKHGRLIDADALLKEFEFARKSADMDGREYANAFRSAGGEISTEWWAVEDMVENAAVVVEAEGEEQ